MAWYAAHVIEYFKYREGKQDVFPVYENIYLIEAKNADIALEKAEKIIEECNKYDDKTLRLNDRPAKAISAGIRRLIDVSHSGEEGVLQNGDEVTYNEFNVFDEKDIQKMLDGEDVNIELNE